MKYSLRTILLVTGLVCLWLSAVATTSPFLLEIASLTTLFTLSLSVPLYFFDQPARRPFWAGFASAGFGLMIASRSLYTPVNETYNLLVDLVTTPVDETSDFRPGKSALGQTMVYLLTFVFALPDGFVAFFMATHPEKKNAG